MNLARIRKLRGLNQRQLAEMIGVDASTIQRAETAHPSAKLETYRKCADALGVTVSDIFSDDRSAVEMEFLRAFRRVPSEKHQQLLALLALAEANGPEADQ
ncbi:helix-turn-helix transcriptional regulator [Cereibacter sphaeroides]|uniref:helix-turn-helix transcriptional regulator n=1 Tax=Cereibacter sphaeroides TaxID=1063 RepID=UPI00313A79AB